MVQTIYSPFSAGIKRFSIYTNSYRRDNMCYEGKAQAEINISIGKIWNNEIITLSESTGSLKNYSHTWGSILIL